MKRYVGIMYDDREPNVITERFVSSVRNEVKDKIDRVYRDFTDPDDGVRPLHLQYDIKEEDAVSLLLNQEELKVLVDIVDEASISKYGRIIHRISSMLNEKFAKEFSSPEDIVTIHCYGSARQMERSKAVEEFTTAISCSEGSEQGRYCRILSDLREGKKVASDGDPVL